MGSTRAPGPRELHLSFFAWGSLPAVYRDAKAQVLVCFVFATFPLRDVNFTQKFVAALMIRDSWRLWQLGTGVGGHGSESCYIHVLDLGYWLRALCCSALSAEWQDETTYDIQVL